MARRKKHSPEEIVAKLRQVEVSTGQGTPVADAVRSIGVTEATYYRWRQEFGGLKLDQVRRLKELEAENTRLRMSAVSACGTDRGYSGTEDFWIIVAIRSEDETETRAGQSAGRADRPGHPARDAPAFFG
jgi:putative transposase